jgi:hypothetical protein
VTRDSTAPTLAFDPEPPTTSSSLVVRIAGTTEPGAFVTVNGINVPAPGGAFATNVTLSVGANTVVVEAQDAVGNAAERRFTITVAAPGSSNLVLPIGLLVLGLALGALLAVLLLRSGRHVPFLPTRRPKEEKREEGTREPAATPDAATPEEGPAQATEATPDDPRVTKLQRAYADGRITEEVYQENLRKLKGSPP